MSEKKVILIVEDEEDLIFMYSAALSAANFSVLQAKNGHESLEILEKNDGNVDLILLDIVMPEMDGIETLEKIKGNEKFKNIPVIVSTNLDNEDDKKQALELGANDYLVKSKYTPSEMVKKVEEFFLGL
jgi:CheY-like chemotaxis protein